MFIIITSSSKSFPFKANTAANI